MKRIVIPLLLALAALVPLVADAGIVRDEKQLVFRKNRAASYFGSLDSIKVGHTGAITDTTAPFTLGGWAPAPFAKEQADSVSLFDVAFQLKDGTTAQALSAAGNNAGVLSVTVQGSWDNGKNWIKATSTGTYPPLLAELGNGSGLTVWKGYAATFPGTITTTAITSNQLLPFPIYRIITACHASTKGVLSGNVYWWRDSPGTTNIGMVIREIPWRKSRAAYYFGSLDSMYVGHTGNVLDTTAVFALGNLAFVRLCSDSALVDSIAGMVAHVDISDGASSTAACTDTVVLTHQVSIDGTTWISASSVPLKPMQVAYGAAAQVYSFFKAYNGTRTGQVTAAAATELEVLLYPLHRFIVESSATTVGVLACRVAWWENRP